MKTTVRGLGGQWGVAFLWGASNELHFQLMWTVAGQLPPGGRRGVGVGGGGPHTPSPGPGGGGGGGGRGVGGLPPPPHSVQRQHG